MLLKIYLNISVYGYCKIKLLKILTWNENTRLKRQTFKNVYNFKLRNNIQLSIMGLNALSISWPLCLILLYF